MLYMLYITVFPCISPYNKATEQCTLVNTVDTI